MYYPKDIGGAGRAGPHQLNGKVLRLDAETGDGVADNPFDPSRPHSVRSRIIAYGIREPYRLYVEAAEKKVYVGDVGSEHYEEIDVIPASCIPSLPGDSSSPSTRSRRTCDRSPPMTSTRSYAASAARPDDVPPGASRIL